MDHLLPDDIYEAKPAGKDGQHRVTSPDSFDLQKLLEAEEAAKTCTDADKFDIATACKAVVKVDVKQTAALKAELSGCGRDLRTAAKQKAKSRETYHLALARSHLIATTALQAPGPLIELAKKRKIPTTKASWKNPYLVVLKIIDPQMDDKTASMCARALNYISAANVPPDRVEDFIAQHGVVALAREEAKRQKLRRGGSSEKPPPVDPLDVLRRDATAVPMPGSLELDGLPQEDGKVALVIVSREEGKLVAWAADADNKSAIAAARRVLKRKMAGEPSQGDGEAS